MAADVMDVFASFLGELEELRDNCSDKGVLTKDLYISAAILTLADVIESTRDPGREFPVRIVTDDEFIKDDE